MDAGAPLFHGSMLVLVDRRRQIRGAYDGLGDDDLTRVYKAINTRHRYRGVIHVEKRAIYQP